MRTTHFHEDFRRAIEETGPSDRSFGLVVGSILLLLGVKPVVHGQLPAWWLAIPGGLLLLAALIRPGWLRTPNRLWMRLGTMLGRLVTPLVLGGIFFLVVTPIGWVMRLCGHDPLRLRPARTAASWWVSRVPPGPSPESMVNQF